MRPSKLIPTLVAFAPIACGLQPLDADTSSARAQTEYGDWGLDLLAVDTSVKPGDNFHRYVSGKWMETYDIPADRNGYGVFDLLQEKISEQMLQIVDELSEGEAEDGTLSRKLGDYYSSRMQRDEYEQLTLRTLEEQLATIEAIDSPAALSHAFGSARHFAPFEFRVIPDPTNPGQHALIGMQSGLGLPNRDFYLRDDANFAALRDGYLKHIERVLSLAETEQPGARAAAILQLETKIAALHWSEADNRQLEKIINPMSVEQLRERAPGLDWRRVFSSAGLPALDTLIVMQPSQFEGAAALARDEPLSVWKDYLAFHFIRANADILPAEFESANFEFYNKQLNGQQEPAPAWRHIIDKMNHSLGEALGREYVARFFPEESKNKVEAIVDDLKRAMRDRLEQSSWMDAATREQALKKLDSFEVRIGHPSKWQDYSELQIVSGDPLGNELRLRAFLQSQEWRKLGRAVERGEWQVSPQSIGAMYHPLLNQLTFPAGMLQPPFFDASADAAVNYGAIGIVIGHEISHGFDDQGRKFDDQGRIRDWWSEASAAEFTARADRLVEQFNQYEPLPGLHINGQLTLGENLGDLGGTELALAAYHLSLNGRPAPKLNGYAGEQRFFMALAQLWRGKQRDEALRQSLLSQPHSPGEYRVNGILRNIDAWYEAFEVEPGDALYLAPEERITIW